MMLNYLEEITEEEMTYEEIEWLNRIETAELIKDLLDDFDNGYQAAINDIYNLLQEYRMSGISSNELINRLVSWINHNEKSA